MKNQLCHKCGAPLKEQSKFCDECGLLATRINNGESKPKRKVGFGLFLGILIFPLFSAWLTLRRGYSGISRFISFTWMGIFIFLFLITITNNDFTPFTNENEILITVSSKQNNNDLPQEYHNIGKTFTLGDFEYVVEKVGFTKFVGTSLLNEQATAGATFVIVTLAMKNNSNKTKSVYINDFKIFDEKERTFKTSSEASTALLAEYEQDFLFSQLQPAIQKQAIAVFELPDYNLSQELFLIVPQKGFFKTSKAVVKIN